MILTICFHHKKYFPDLIFNPKWHFLEILFPIAYYDVYSTKQIFPESILLVCEKNILPDIRCQNKKPRVPPESSWRQMPQEINEPASPKLGFWLLGVFIVQLLGNGRWLSSRGSEVCQCAPMCVFLPSVKENVWSVDDACLYVLAPRWAGWHYPLQLQGPSMFIVCCLSSKRSERCHGARGHKGRFRPLPVLQLRFLGWKCFESFCFPAGS